MSVRGISIDVIMKRRGFIKCVGHSLALPTVLSSFGLQSVSAKALRAFMSSAAEQGRVLVLVYMQGGNDGLNTIIPLDNLSVLKGLRPAVALEDKDMLQLSKAPLAFHPSLSGFRSLYDENRLVVVQNVGYPEQNFSHFRSTDIWITASDSNKIEDTGWMGRYLNETFEGYPEEYPNEEFQDPLAIEFGSSSTALFQGPNAAMSMVINNPDTFYDLLDEIESPVPDTPAGEKLKYIRLIAKQSQQYGAVVKKAAELSGERAGYPNTNLGDQLKIVARLIAGGLKTPIYRVQLGSFDTHNDQVDTDRKTGRHADLLRQLNDAVVAFMSDLEKMGRGDDVVGMTYSEFGRRIASNGSNGTDHGAAAPLFVFGNKVAGGVLGSNPILDASMDHRDNLTMQHDFRQVYASILDQWFGVDSIQMNATMFKDFDTMPIISGAIASVKTERLPSLSVHPNPLNGQATIAFDSNAAMFTIDLVDIQGRLIERIHRGVGQSGALLLSWDTSYLSGGRYFVVLQQKDNDQIFSVVK